MERFGLKLGVELTAYIPAVVLQFQNFRQPSVGRLTRHYHSRLLKGLPVGGIKFVAVAVTLVYLLPTVYIPRLGSLQYYAGVSPEAHCAAQLFNLSLFGEDIYNRVGGIGVKFGGVGVL